MGLRVNSDLFKKWMRYENKFGWREPPSERPTMHPQETSCSAWVPGGGS